MKKFGFTLAEVLITLAIIGVVAVLTLPALMNNVGEQQYVTGMKKGLNTFTEAAQLSQSLTGYDYDSLAKTSQATHTTVKDPTSLYGMLRDRLSIDEKAVSDQSAPGQPNGYKDTNNFLIYLRDNSILHFGNQSLTAGQGQLAVAEDGHIAGIKAKLDVNGVKGPNLLSNCNGGVSASTTTDNASGHNCSDNKKRIIKDQFSIILRGNTALPNGPAARWAALK